MKILFKSIYRYSPFLNFLVTFSAIAYCFNTVDLTGLDHVAISWYGRFSDTALVFNVGALFSGILNLLFAHRVFCAVKRSNYKNGELIGVIALAASIGSFGIALIPVPWYREELFLRFIHSFFAMMTIFLWPVVGILIAYGKRESDNLETTKRIKLLKVIIRVALIVTAVAMYIITKLGGGFWEYELLFAGIIPILITAMWWWVEGVLEARTKKK